MLIFSRAPLFLWAEAIATACFTQNRSIIHRRFNKTPYELINGRKPNISFLHVFSALCYPKNDREDIGKLGAKGDIGFFIGYSTDSCAYRVYNHRTKKIMETMNVSFDELSAMAFEQRSSKPGLQSMTSGQISSGLDLNYASLTITTQQPSEGELDLLFEAMYDDYIGVQPSATARTVLPAQEPQVQINDDDEDLPRKRKSSQQKIKRRLEKDDPTVGLLREPSRKFDYYVLYPKAELSQPPPTRHANTISLAEATMNWQSENAVAQNKVLVKILSQQKSTVQFDAEEYEGHQENPNQETPTKFPKSDIKQYFTFDDVPPSKWRERSIEMLSWCTAKLQYYTIDVVIKRFLTRLQGRLRDCYHSLDDVNLKQVFLNSFLESLRNEAYRALEASLSGKPRFSRRSNKKWKFIGKKKQRGKTSDRCFICQKRGHFSRNCPDKKISQALIQALNKVEPVDVSDLELLYSLDDKPSDSVLCTIAYSDLSSDDDFDTDSPESDSDFGVHLINPIPHLLPIQEDPPLPLAKFHLLTDAYAKPIPVIAFFDTGSSVSILNFNILPDHYWKPHHQNFIAANEEKFVIDKISIPINIWLFPKCVIKRRLLGEGLHYRSFFNPWTAMHHLFVASITPPIFNINSIKKRLIQTCCASSHTEFLTKHPSLLWLNPSFFVSLPFKQNEDVKPTKASHPGMNPDHYQLAKEECEQLVSQGIIEPTISPWACEAFYFNKRSEQVRGKLRLVINYQPLNHFLADDKFPIPQKKSLFQHLADARVLSKFNLKYGFWQLGIKPEDRPKTVFCTPDHQYQWKSHAELLSKFYSLVTKDAIMLSEKKMEVGVTTIQFLGMEIFDGKYQPHPHVAQELLKFPDELSS
nr:putative reverse transcriptase domain, viral movement protein [Tanacetum cinerariifolium]